MTLADLMKEMAAEDKAKRNGGQGKASATLVPTVTAQQWQCDCCGRRKPQAHFSASRGICRACVRNPGI